MEGFPQKEGPARGAAKRGLRSGNEVGTDSGMGAGRNRRTNSWAFVGCASYVLLFFGSCWCIFGHMSLRVQQ